MMITLLLLLLSSLSLYPLLRRLDWCSVVCVPCWLMLIKCFPNSGEMPRAQIVIDVMSSAPFSGGVIDRV